MINTKNKKNNIVFMNRLLKLIIIYTSFVVGLIVFYRCYDISGYKYMFAVPILYGLCYGFSDINVFQFRGIGIFFCNFFMFVRYVVTPFMIAWSQYYIGTGFSEPDAESYLIAFLLIIYEMMVIFCVIHIFGHKVYDTKSRVKYEPINSRILYLVIILVAIICITLYPGILQSYNFIDIKDDIYRVKSDKLYIGGLYLIVDYAKIIITFLFIDLFKKKYDRTNKSLYFWLSIIAYLPNIVFFRGLSRASIFIPTVSGIVVFSYLYPDRRRNILVTFIGILSISMASITLYKTFGLTEERIYTTKMISGMLQAYFAGPRNVGIGVVAKTYFYNRIDITTMINDFFLNVPILSHYVNYLNSSNSMFNYIIYFSTAYADQIVPLITQGYFYFGFIGAPIFTAINVWLMMKFDKRCNSESCIEFKYIFASAAIMFGLYYNISILNAFVTQQLIPLLVIFNVNRKIYFTNKRF